MGSKKGGHVKAGVIVKELRGSRRGLSEATETRSYVYKGRKSGTQDLNNRQTELNRRNYRGPRSVPSERVVEGTD